jgi:Protein of unknown function (DUF2637)
VWARLPTNLRTILGCALVLGIGVTAAAFTLSFFALRAVASNPQLEFGKGHAWLFPIALDMALVFAEVLLLGASMVQGYNRAIPILLVLAFGVGTLYFNVTRVPDSVRLITAVPPVASILMTIGLAYLMKMLTTLAGGVQAYHAPPPAYGMLGTPGGPLQGAVWRQDASPYGTPAGGAPYGHLGSPTASTLGQNGHGEEVKRDRIRAYLSRLSGRPQALAIATGSSVVEGVQHEEGITVSIREASRELDTFRDAQPKPARNGRRR